MRLSPRFTLRVLALLPLLALSACTKKAGTGSDVRPEGGEAAAARTVNLAIWSNYVSPELLEEFRKKTGIKVEVSNYSSNEELLAKLQAGASGYDVAVPSDYMVSAMTHLGLLQRLDKAQLGNLSQQDPKFLNKGYDPGNVVSVPYDWGTTGIAVNTEKYKGEIKGWKDLFTKADLKGKFTLLDDSRETIGAALKSQGLSLNSRNPADLARAKEVLTQAKANVKGFTSEPMMPLVNGETAVAHAFMSDALQAARQSGGKIRYILPEEGGTFYVDNLVVPKGALHLKEAHEFINFLLDKNSSVTTVKHILVAPTNLGVKALLPADVQSNPVLFPPEAVLGKFEMMQDLGDALAAWDRVWTEVKAGQ